MSDYNKQEMIEEKEYVEPEEFSLSKLEGGKVVKEEEKSENIPKEETSIKGILKAAFLWPISLFSTFCGVYAFLEPEKLSFYVASLGFFLLAFATCPAIYEHYRNRIYQENRWKIIVISILMAVLGIGI